MMRVPNFTLVRGNLYRRSFSRPLLKCLSPEEIEYVMRKIHEGISEGHVGENMLSQKVLLASYY